MVTSISRNGHEEMYQEVMMVDHHNLISLVGFGNKNQDGLDPAVPSLNHLKYEDRAINVNIQGTGEEPHSCPMAVVAVTTMTQYPSITTEEKPTCHKGNITDSDLQSPIDHTICGAPHYMEKPCSYNVTNIPNHNIYILNPQYPSTHIKEEPFLTDPTIYTPIDDTPQHPATTALCDEDLLDLSDSITSDHTQLMFSHIKKKPVSSDGGTLLEPNIDTPTNHTQYKSHIKEEPVSCDEGNRNDPDSYTRTGHTQHYPTNIKAEEVKCVEDCTGANGFPSIDLFSIKKEPVSPKSVDKDISKRENKEPEQNYNLTISKKYFYTIQQTANSLEILYNCPECPERFMSNLELVKHQVIHTVGMPHICSVCGRCFGKKSDLVIHQVTHGGSSSFRCPYCELSFVTKSSLSIHEKTHGQKELMPCPECGKSFPTKKRLTAHRKIHTHERPFECSQCGDTFKRKGHLQRHQTAHEKSAHKTGQEKKNVYMWTVSDSIVELL